MAILAGEYPNNWDEFIGQAKAKRQLRIAARSAKMRGKNLGHCLLKSPYAGIGKTALGLLLAKEMDTEVVITTGAMNLSQVAMLFTKLDPGDILFIDEIHKVMDGGKKNAEWLLHYLENGVLMTPLGPEEVPAVTVIGATTDAATLPVPIRQRFSLVPDLVPYTDEEGTQIAMMMARKVMVVDGLPLVSQEVGAAIALASSNRPRLMRSLLEGLRDLALVGEIASPRNGKYDIAETLTFAGLTPDGLTAEAQTYMRVMINEFQGGPAGAAPLRERLGEVGKGLSEIEQLLTDKELLGRTSRGRLLTAAGRKRGTALVEAAKAAK